MAKPATTRPVGTLHAILLCCAAATSAVASGALAQDSNQTTVNQVQLGDVFAAQTINVQSAPNGVSAATTALGNTATGIGSGVPIDYQASQEVNAEVNAQTTASVTGPVGVSGFYVTTSATGNSGTAGTCCAATTGDVTQKVDGYHGVAAISNVSANGESGTVSVDSAAIGNTQGWEAVNGSINSTTTQTHYGTTDAETTANLQAADEASYTATAVANNVTTDATASSTNQTVSQDTYGFADIANVNVTQGYAGDVVAAATSTANNVNVVADSGEADLNVDQRDGRPVTATANLDVQSWSGGATASAYGVANSAIVSNAGPTTNITAEQNTLGPVTVNASFTGGSGGAGGGDALVSATGVGNAVSGYACSTCNGTVRASVTQTSSGGVQTNATINGGNMNSATGISTAIGNTATFVVQKSGG